MKNSEHLVLSKKCQKICEQENSKEKSKKKIRIFACSFTSSLSFGRAAEWGYTHQKHFAVAVYRLGFSHHSSVAISKNQSID